MKLSLATVLTVAGTALAPTALGFAPVSQSSALRQRSAAVPRGITPRGMVATNVEAEAEASTETPEFVGGVGQKRKKSKEVRPRDEEIPSLTYYLCVCVHLLVFIYARSWGGRMPHLLKIARRAQQTQIWNC
jgi:hypothetical protein